MRLRKRVKSVRTMTKSAYNQNLEHMSEYKSKQVKGEQEDRQEIKEMYVEICLENEYDRHQSQIDLAQKARKDE